MTPTAAPNWILAIGLLESADSWTDETEPTLALSSNSRFIPIDWWGPSIDDPLLVIAQLVGERLPESTGIQFCLRDEGGNVLWQASILTQALNDGGEIFLGDGALMPDSFELGLENLILTLEKNKEQVASLRIDRRNLGAAKRALASSVTAPAHVPEPIVSPTTAVDDLDVLHRACEQAIAEWIRLAGEEEASEREVQKSRDRLKQLQVEAGNNTHYARKLMADLGKGEWEWVNQSSVMIADIRAALDDWKRLFAPLGAGSQRESITALLRQASTVRSFYQMDGWGWLASTKNLQERRVMIEALLDRCSRYVIHN